MAGWVRDPLGIVQEIWIWTYEQGVHAQPRIRPRESNAQSSLGIWDKNGSTNLDQGTKPIDSQYKKDACRTVDFAVPTDPWVKLKVDNREKYLDLAKKLIKRWKLNVTVIKL